MKQTFKKLMSLALMVICVVALTACGSSAKEEVKVDETLRSNMTTTAEGLTEAIAVLSSEEIASYKDSGDAFTTSAMEAWETNRDELGEYKGIGKSEFSESTDGYVVTVPIECSNRNGSLVYVFDEEGTPTAMSVDVEYTMGEKMEQAGLNTLMGVCIVFCMLIFLALLISLFKFIPVLEEKLANKGTKAAQAAPEKAPVEVAKAPAPVAAQTDDSELIAVIAAAIAASEGTSTDSFVVRSIKKVNRRKW